MRWDHGNYYSPEPDCWKQVKAHRKKKKKAPSLRREKNLSFPGSSPGDPLGGCLSDLF